MEIKGKIIATLEPRGGVSRTTGTKWVTQDFVIETLEQYPHRMCFNVFGEDKIREMGLEVGQVYTVFFDINSREFEGRWFNDIRGWKAVKE